MTTKVKLNDIVEGMEIQLDESSTLVNIKTGEVIYVSDANLRNAEDGDSFEGLRDWQQEELEVAYDVIENEENYIELPTEYDIHEYSMIENFCLTVKDPKAQGLLLRAIRGKGAFGRFKDQAFDLGLEQDWYTYRDERYKQIAIEFCKNVKNIIWNMLNEVRV
ncbi:UPF0158 family protein [Virgibacillus sp. C22-A2]|uniref:UPF0158 family protein n=1 Tax=Virgibacillus tibetensis TaxID=3042313 RepID=A0ABU6KJF8_9BACI|nr:UPF0158 family protein [Virgibacillus sp. C22-A2]